MAQQPINIGTFPNDHTGDSIRSGIIKANANFTDLYTNSYATNVVTSFNARTGNVVLTSLDVTNTLGYTPLQTTNISTQGALQFNAGFIVEGILTNTFNAATLTQLPAISSKTLLRIVNSDTLSTVLSQDSFINGGNPTTGILLRGARGTAISPNAIQNGDIIGSVNGYGYGATQFNATENASIKFIASGAFTDTSQPTDISFRTTATGSVTQLEAARLVSTGALNIVSGINSSSTSTGALLVTGGVGVGGSLYVAGVLNATSFGSGTLAAGGGGAITGGTIDNVAIGSTTPGAGTFTTLNMSGNAFFTNPVPFSSGGTGLATIPAFGIVSSTGSAITSITPGATGTALVGAGTSSLPVFGIPAGTLLNVQVFAASGTYTPTAGTNSVIVECQAAGGGSGGTAATSGTQNSASAGSASGSYAKVWFSSGFSGVTVTVGSGGTAGTAGANTGGTGGTSSFGTLISCPGGTGGNGGVALTTFGISSGQPAITSPPTITGGVTILSIFGSPDLFFVGGTVYTFGVMALSGRGGSSFLGLGAPASGATVPNGGAGYGYGVSGVVNFASGAAVAGGIGGPGIVLVYEYA